MSKSKKNARDKQRKRLKARRARLDRHEPTSSDLLASHVGKGPSGLPAGRLKALATTNAKSAEPEQEKAPTDYWSDEFSAAEPDHKLEMVREKLSEEQRDEDWFEFAFPDSLDSLLDRLPRSQYVAFLEEMEQTWPEAFASEKLWAFWTMAFEYVATSQFEKLDAAAYRLAEQLDVLDPPIFSLISYLRLVGRIEPVQCLIQAATAQTDESDTSRWLPEKMIEWALFQPYQECVRAGATADAIEAVHQYTRSLGVQMKPQHLDNQRQFALHLAGKSGSEWSRDDFPSDAGQAGRNMYLLLVDYMRWLCQSHSFCPLVADELRRILLTTINDMTDDPRLLLEALRPAVFEKALSPHFEFMSLDGFHGPAAAVAMRRFYIFLAELNLVDARTAQRADGVCSKMWDKMKQALQPQWPEYAFIERYWEI